MCYPELACETFHAVQTANGELDAVSLLIVAYLFLGGAGAGAFFVVACVDIANERSSKERSRSLDRMCREELVRRGYAVSFGALLLGALCLLADLGRPEAAYLLFARPTLSYISVGTYSLTALLLCVATCSAPRLFALPKALRRAKTVALPLGMAASLFVMTYTGVFLQSMSAVPLWDSPWLIALFLLSSLSSGVAVALLCSMGLGMSGARRKTLQRLTKLDLVLVALEVVACFGFLVFASGSELGGLAVERLLVGDWSPAFVGGFAVGGLVVPGVLEAVSLRKSSGEAIDMGIACLVLVGSFCLRLGLVSAGIHSGI